MAGRPWFCGKDPPPFGSQHSGIPASGPNDRVLITLVAHTTSPRGSNFEISIPVRFLKTGAFDAQNLLTIPRAKLVRRLGELSADQLAQVEEAVRRWLGL